MAKKLLTATSGFSWLTTTPKSLSRRAQRSRRQDYQVLVARDGNQGLGLIEARKPRPHYSRHDDAERSGFLVLERLKRLGEKKHRIIMISGQRRESS